MYSIVYVIKDMLKKKMSADLLGKLITIEAVQEILRVIFFFFVTQFSGDSYLHRVNSLTFSVQVTQ